MAAAKAAAQARAAEAQQKFEASAESVSYAELEKDSSPFIGKAVVFTGQILQIQQDGKNGGMMLLSVTNLGDNVWTDNVWLDYGNSTAANSNDVITVYGTVTGTKSYATQAGGNTYVPEIRAKYIAFNGEAENVSGFDGYSAGGTGNTGFGDTGNSGSGNTGSTGNTGFGNSGNTGSF